MASSPNRIFLGPGAPLRREDGKTDETITPGYLLELGGGEDLQKHSTAGAAGTMPMFALEPEGFISRGDTKLIDQDYVDGDTVSYVIAQRGDRIFAWLPATTDASAEGTLLESNGDGTLRIHVPQAVDEAGSATFDVLPQAIVARVPIGEGVNNSGGSEGRIVVEVL